MTQPGAERIVLARGWQLADCAPGVASDPMGAEALDWRLIDTLGCVAQIELANGRWSLDDPLPRLDGRDWWYRLDFDAPIDRDPSRLRLGFDGLATLAQVWLNGQPLLDSDNMFISHVCVPGASMRATGNRLVLRFASLDQALTARRPRPRWRAPMVEHQQLRWFRTSLLGRAPGWSPACPPIGPWRDVWLEPEGGLELRVTRQLASLVAADPADPAGADAVTGQAGRFELACIVRGGSIASVRFELQRGDDVFSGVMVRDSATPDGWSGESLIPRIDPWWPFTHGEPACYQARLVIDSPERGSMTVTLPAVGFRSIEIDQANEGFGLRVNGVPVFCRGACWTPLDVQSLRATPDDYQNAITTVRAGGMNMLRVTGTMVYEDPAFYDACDRQGVLVWHDLMFANMDYPHDNADFMASVEVEVGQLMDRLRGRPSLAVICGNSEVAQQAAMASAPRDRWSSPLFEQHLPRLVRAALPDTAWWTSSAFGGAFPHQVDVGTTSYYGVGAYRRPLADARRSGLKFATECLAFANVPDAATIARLPGGATPRVTHPGWKSRTPRDQGAGWDFEDVRDVYLAQLYGVEPTALRWSDPERYLRLSAAVTGDVMRQAFSEWRRHGSDCRGALILFLRDLWAGAGWGLLDDKGRPKACWRMLSPVLQPRTVLLTDEGSSGLFAHLINESATSFSASLQVQVCRGATILEQAQRRVELAPRETRAVPLVDLLDHFMDLNDAYHFGPLVHDAVIVTVTPENGDAEPSPPARAFYLPRGPLLPAVADLGLATDAVVQPDASVRITVSTRQLATGVWFDTPGYEVDDEYFHLAPGQSHIVTARPLVSPAPYWRGSVGAFNALTPTVIAVKTG